MQASECNYSVETISKICTSTVSNHNHLKAIQLSANITHKDTEPSVTPYRSRYRDKHPRACHRRREGTRIEVGTERTRDA